ncbi:COG1361 S-layer family protein [Methanococcoides orientis]|uniref:COG1361 S-layer family protein n=1 Tax=Methanococcoides orientis TaxID=2822137 RepID=UPI001E41902E|nr:COG1361 S-layer family protein [Methanococcoides orientis]UGV41152.1 COG1361 S-layer family protein [Methanococcoides orientis]
MNPKVRPLCLFLFVLAIVLTGVAAAEFTGGEICVNAEIKELIPSSVGIDEEFTLAIDLESCGSKAPEDITFEIISIPPDIIVTESLVTRIAEFSYPTSERHLVYHMRTTPGANPGPHIIKMKLTYANKELETTKYYEVDVRVTGEDAEPRISSITTNPEYIYEGETVDLTLGIENFGEAIAKSVSVSVDHGFKGIKNSTIGTLDLNGSQTALFKFKADRAGEFNIPVIIKYEDDFGKQSDEYDITITILDKKGSLNLASVKVDPVIPYVDDTVELTMRIENSGDRKINSIRVYADHPFMGLKESFIGTLDPNEDGPAVITFIADEAGEYEIPVTITYIDDFGEEQVETKISIIVMESNSGIGSAVLVLLVLAVIGGLVYYNYRTKRSKDEIIKQLMEGSNNSAGKKEDEE